MATQAVNQRSRREMQEVKAPALFQFTKQGQQLSGIFISIEPETVTDKQTNQQKPVTAYYFAGENGDRVKCYATADLEKKLQPTHLGHWVEIRYETDMTEGQKPGQSAMKVFKVLVGKNIEPGYEHLQAA
jgi:hypothetical protein